MSFDTERAPNGENQLRKRKNRIMNFDNSLSLSPRAAELHIHSVDLLFFE